MFMRKLSWQIFFKVFIQLFFLCRPSDSTVSEDAGIEQRTVATLALTVRLSKHLARSHPQTRSHPRICKQFFSCLSIDHREKFSRRYPYIA
jgi:hypothetical protein